MKAHEAGLRDRPPCPDVFRRTREWAATHRGEDFGTYDYATRYEIPLAPLPCARHLSPDEYQDEVIQLIERIQDDCAKARDGRPVAGLDAVLKQSPFERPMARRPKRSPKPRFHVASKEALDELNAEFGLSHRPWYNYGNGPDMMERPVQISIDKDVFGRIVSDPKAGEDDRTAFIRSVVRLSLGGWNP